jgi:dimethylaniline monooxygenase (N-oxide forming)
MHSHEYVDTEGFEGRNVVVLGMGNSAMDIAVEVSLVTANTYLAARRGAWIVPNYLFGKPSDQLPVNTRIPFKLRQRWFHELVKRVVGNPADFGLPEPDHLLGQAHPTISNYILARVAHGEVVPKPNIAALEGSRVRFDDGSVEDVDVLVYCTGYKITFPFFDPGLISAPDNDLPLFRRVFHPTVDNVFFLALLQPLGATMPLAEAQAHWVAHHLRGEYHLPDAAAVRADMEAERERMFKRYVRSKRHTMQVDFDDYLFELRRELERGAERARRAGFALPLTARAGAAEEVAVR